jgi:Flp pilus assembly protein TadD
MQTRQFLWEQLIRLNRDAEAEEDIKSVTEIANVDEYSIMRIELAQRQGDFGRSVAMAAQTVEQRPNDFVSHLVLAKAATAAAVSSADGDHKLQLMEQAKGAIENAKNLAAKVEPSIEATRLRWAEATGEKQQIETTLSSISTSNLPEFDKLVLMSQGNVVLGKLEEAIAYLRAADKLKPSAQIQLALSQLHHRLDQPEAEVTSLRTAYQRNPSNGKLRTELARALASRTDKQIDWNEIRDLLSSTGVNSGDRLLYAILLAIGNNPSTDPVAAKKRVLAPAERLEESSAILRELIAEKHSTSNDAARFLAVLNLERTNSLSADQQGSKSALMSETKRLLELLANQNNPTWLDQFRYASFLLSFGTADEYKRVEPIISSLSEKPEAAAATLNLRLRLAHARGDKNSEDIVNNWANDAISRGMLSDANVASVAADTLLQFGLPDPGIAWMQRAYAQNRELLATYVVLLSRFQKQEDAAKICSLHFQENEDKISGQLYLEALASLKRPPTEDEDLLAKQIVTKYPADAAILESAGTLRLENGEYKTAAELFQRARVIEPNRVRTLNNLAMSLAELPGHATQALEPIEIALKLTNQNPELLDTKGVVLLQCGRFQEAQQVFEDLTKLSDDVRFKFHLVLALLEQDKKDESARLLSTFNKEQIDTAGLTKREIDKLHQLISETDQGGNL